MPSKNDDQGKGMQLTLFSRIPRPGHSKTRLIPTLGTVAAARLQQSMTLRALSHARSLENRFPRLRWTLCVDGPMADIPFYFGHVPNSRQQPEADLGARMEQCFQAAEADGVERHVLIGSDVPNLNSEILAEAFDALKNSDLVLGPAEDGGYYLIGLAPTAPPGLFDGVPWGTEDVLSATLANARHLKLSVHQLQPLPDVDVVSDLGYWHRVANEWPAKPEGVSVILPVLNEAEGIGSRIRTLLEQGADEVIVVDGGSQDDSCEQARAAGAVLIQTEPGRGRQMNAGARVAVHEALLFLHADTELESSWRSQLFESLNDSKTVGGAFRFRLDGRAWRYRLLEQLVKLRTRLLKRPYGDQGLFCRREAFFRVGGFPEVAVMEDYIFVGQLRREGRLEILDTAATSSTRNWERAGFWRVSLAHRLMILGYHLGFSLDRLAAIRRRLLQ